MYETPYGDSNKTDFTHVSVTKNDSDKHPIIYACGADNVIREIEPMEKEGSTPVLKAKVKYEEHV